MSVDTMTGSNWEYRVVPIGLLRSRIEVRLQNILDRRATPENTKEGRPEAEQQLNALGRDGWELASVVSEGKRLTAILKRPIG
jgi:hypothetical protein